MSLIMKRYRRLVKELIYVYSELEFIEEAASEIHANFETYYQEFCKRKNVPLEELNKSNSEKLEKVFPKKKLPEVDEAGIIKKQEAEGTKVTKDVQRVFTKMYRSLTSLIHPDKFANQEQTQEVKEKTNHFKSATSAYNSRNWSKFLDICEKFDVYPTRYDGLNKVIADEISDINKKIVEKKKMFSWRLYECEEDTECKDKIVENFLFQLFRYRIETNN